jgi:crotonobetainyl-CoA:carnitine CoA-transferase CaiB-like acyl-CoA transferase
VRAPLAGIEVLDLGTLTPGKYCTFLLADLGAKVLRVERPRDRSERLSDEDLLLNRGKRSLTLDLRDAAGRAVFARLAERADVVIEGSRPGVAERIGVDHARLAERNPRLVYCSLSGFGQDGPNRLRPAYDLIFMALSGALQATFGRDATPRPPGLYLADTCSGLMAAFAIAVALLARERDGEGRYLDLAMFDSVFSLLSTSHGVQRAGHRPVEGVGAPLYDVYEAADGRRIALGAIRPASCAALFEALGRPELAPRAFSPDAAEEIATFLSGAFAGATGAEWSERLGALDIEIGEVRTPEEAFDDAQLAFRGMVLDVDHPQAGRLRQIGSPLRAGAAEPQEPPRPAPAIGADSDDVLRELGLSAAEISRLRDAGVV